MILPELTVETDVLIIVPPFIMTNYQSLAAHVLQGVAKEAGFQVRVFYANMHYASYVGELYPRLCESDPDLKGERLFAPLAWALNQENLLSYQKKNQDISQVFYPPQKSFSSEELQTFQRKTVEWLDSLEKSLSQIKAPVVGLTCSTEQINASFSILKKIKQSRPDILTLFGGYSAEGVMAEGIASLDPDREILDYIFSGESESVFVNFLNGWKQSNLPQNRIQIGKALKDMNNLPSLDYTDYFNQLNKFLPEEAQNDSAMMAMETSRGCWWGEKSHCLFCGYSDERLEYRQKSTEKFLTEIKGMEKYNSRYLHMADLIMPKTHFEDLMSNLCKEESPWTIYYEQRAIWNRNQLEAMAAAGFRDNQPGIESLSTPLLKRMGKGSSLARNIRFLKDATGAGLKMYWNFVWGFPGETVEHYKDMIELIPLISHLIPPMAIFQLALSRFSPLFEERKKWKVTKVKPLYSYKDVLPPWADLEKLAYYFTCQYDAETFRDTTIITEFISVVSEWVESWKNIITQPRLQLSRSGSGELFLLDSRALGQPMQSKLSLQEAVLFLDNLPYENTPAQQNAVKQKQALVLDGQFVPLVTMDSKQYKELEDYVEKTKRCIHMG